MALSIREGRPEDAQECGRICYEAFAAIANVHNFPPDFASVESGVGLANWLLSAPSIYSVVAEDDGRIVGSNFLAEDSAISGVGPISIDPNVQNRGVGSKLMQAVMERSAARRHAGIRLVQSGYHCRSFSLYSKLGFDVREHLTCFVGNAPGRKMAGYDVRAAREGDVPTLDALCFRVHGFNRHGEVANAVTEGAARVVERDGRITGYVTHIAFFGHAVAETTDDLKALIANTGQIPHPGFLVPSRDSELLRWCFENGLRMSQSLTLMTIGLYNEPQGAWLPSILY